MVYLNNYRSSLGHRFDDRIFDILNVDTSSNTLEIHNDEDIDKLPKLFQIDWLKNMKL